VQKEVDLLGRNVQKLIDFTKPARPHPLVCTIEEISIAALGEVPQRKREELRVTTTTTEGRLEIDGPILTSALRRLVENSFEAGCEHVHLEAHQDERFTRFVIIDSGPGGFEPTEAASPFQSSKPNHLGLGLALVHRDLSMLGGWLEFHQSPDGETQAIVTVPNRPSREEAA